MLLFCLFLWCHLLDFLLCKLFLAFYFLLLNFLLAYFFYLFQHCSYLLVQLLRVLLLFYIEIKPLRILTQVKQRLGLYFERTHKLGIGTWVFIRIELMLTVINKLNNRIKRHPNPITLRTFLRQCFIIINLGLELIYFRIDDIRLCRKLIPTLFQLPFYVIDSKYLNVLKMCKYRLVLDWNFE